MAGGINGSRAMPWRTIVDSRLGGQVTTVYDMANTVASRGPTLPWRSNHNVGAISADGKFHNTGGYRQNAFKTQSKAYALHAMWDVRSGLAGGGAPTGTWTMLAPMLYPRGGHTCQFLLDGRMYCVGGGREQVDHPSAKLQIYDPSKDAWLLGPEAPTARDHVTSFVSEDKNILWVIGGRGSIGAGYAAWDPSKTTANEEVEAYSLLSSAWTVRSTNLNPNPNIISIDVATQP
jgi:hypothetical protein